MHSKQLLIVSPFFVVGGSDAKTIGFFYQIFDNLEQLETSQ